MNIRKYQRDLENYAAALNRASDMIRCLIEFEGSKAAEEAVTKLIDASALPSAEYLKGVKNDVKTTAIYAHRSNHS